MSGAIGASDVVLAERGAGADAGQPPDPMRVVDLRLMSGQVVGEPLRTTDTVHKAKSKAAQALGIDVQTVSLVCPIRGQLTQDDALLGGPVFVHGTRVVLQVMFEALVELRMMSGELVGEQLRITDTVRTARLKAAEFLQKELHRISLVCLVRGILTQDDDQLAGPEFFPGQPVITLNVLCAAADGGVKGDPRRGLSIGYLLGKLTADLNIGSGENVYDIRDRICAKGEGALCPRDGRKGAAYVDVADDEDAGTATLMLSYTWGYLVNDILSALRLYCRDNKLGMATTRVWMCCLCVNQQRVRENPNNRSPNAFMRRFHPLFTRSGGDTWNIKVVGLLSPWKKPLYVKRIWCLFEAWKATRTSGVELDFMLPELEAQDFHRSLLVDNGLDPVLKGLSNIKVEHAEAFVGAEGERLRELILEDGTYSTFEASVKGQLQKWFIDAARKSPQASAGPHFQPTACRNIADVMTRLGHHKDCLKFLETSISNCERGTGGAGDARTKSIDLAQLYLYLGRNLGTSGDQEGAMEKCQKAYEFCEKVREGGMTEVEAEVLRTIASISRKNGELQKAFKQYSEALAVYEILKGSDQFMALDSAWILLNLGIVWGLLRESSLEVPDAEDVNLTKFGYVEWDDLKYFDKAWEIYQHHGKDDTPTAAWLLRNRGVSYLRVDRLHEAREEFTRAQQIYEAHANTNVENYGELRKSQGMLHLAEEKYAEAAKCFEDARKVFLERVMTMEHGLSNSMRSLHDFYIQREDMVSAREILNKENELQAKLFSPAKLQRVHVLRSKSQLSEFGSRCSGGELPQAGRRGLSTSGTGELEACEEELGEAEGGPPEPLDQQVHFEAFKDGTTTLSTRNGKVKITVPEGAVDGDKLAQFDIRRLDDPTIADPIGDRCSDVYQMTPSGSFEEPVLLRMQVDRSPGCGCAGGVRILRLQDGASEWKLVRHCWTDDEGYVCAWIPGFSHFCLGCCYPTLRVSKLVSGADLKVSVAFGVEGQLPKVAEGWELVEEDECVGKYTHDQQYEVKVRAYDANDESRQEEHKKEFTWDHERKMAGWKAHFDASKFGASDLVKLQIRLGEKSLATWNLWRPRPATAAASAAAAATGPEAAPAAPVKDKSHPLLPVAALCVGNNDYQGCPLQVAVSDATQVHAKLLEMGWLGEEAKLATNVSLDNFRRYCSDFVEKVKAKIEEQEWSPTTPRPLWLAFVFYAGHGTMPPKGDGVLMWPVDVPFGKDTQQAVNLHRALLRELVRVKVPRQARFVCVLCLDCCREELAAKSVESYLHASSPADTDQADGRLPTFSRAEFLIAWACGNERQSIEDEHGGMFTRAMLRNLDARDEEFYHTLKAVQAEVLRASSGRQRPCITDDAQQLFKFTSREMKAGRDRLEAAAKAKAKAQAAPEAASQAAPQPPGQP